MAEKRGQMTEVLGGILQSVRPQEDAFVIYGAPDVFAALCKAQAEFTDIVRSKTVTVRSDKGNYTFDYAPLESVLAATVPALNKHGLSLLQPLVKEGDDWVLRTILAHSSGSYIVTRLIIPSPERGGWQALGGAITYARRYMVGALLGVSPEEDDDGTTAEGMHREVQQKGPRANTQPTPPKPPVKAKPPESPKDELVEALSKSTETARPASVPPPAATPPPVSVDLNGPVTDEQKKKSGSLLRLLGLTSRSQADALALELVGAPSLVAISTHAQAEKFISLLEDRIQTGGT